MENGLLQALKRKKIIFVYVFALKFLKLFHIF